LSDGGQIKGKTFQDGAAEKESAEILPRSSSANSAPSAVNSGEK
jgi:hypothetical protein